MYILIVDDSPLHRTSAQQTLKGHELKIVGTYDEAYKLLKKPEEPWDVAFDVVLCDLLMPASNMTMGPEGMEYVGQEMPVGFALALMAALHGAKYVAVVTDTSHHDHPASAMLDAFKSEYPDVYNPRGQPPRFVINGAKVGYYHARKMLVEGTICPDCNGTDGKDTCGCVKENAGQPKPDCSYCKGTGRECWTCGNSGKDWGKDWGKVIAHLTA